MKIVFAGTPEYAVPSLLALMNSSHELVALVSQPDRPKGRSGQPTPPPVVAAALEKGYPHERILQPERFNAPEVLNILRGLQPDLFCVVAYGGLLSTRALAIPRLCALNAHGSLLPRYRGAAPIQAALMNGDKETGVTMMQMVKALDAGPMLFQLRVSIQPEDTAGTLHDKLAVLSAQGFVDALQALENGAAHFEPQNELQASYAPKLTKESGLVDWKQDADSIQRLVRAMTPWPGAWTAIEQGEKLCRVRLEKVEPCAFSGRLKAGAIKLEGNQLTICCGDGRGLRLLTLQPQGKATMSVSAFLCGAGREIKETACFVKF